MTSLRAILRRWFGASGEAGESGPRAPEWPALPPLETIAGAIDLVGESRSFASGLTGATRLGVAGRALTHGAGLDGPRGKVAGVPVVARRRSGAPALLRRHRRAVERPGQAQVWEETVEPGAARDAIETPQRGSSQQETPRAVERPAPRGPHATKPDAVKPDAVKPDAVKPDAVKPDAVKPDAVKPDAVKPDAVEPDAVKPDAVKPDAVKPDAVKPRATKRIQVKVRKPASPRGTSRRAEDPALVPTPVERTLPVVPGKPSAAPVAPGLGRTPVPQAPQAGDPSTTAPPTAVPVPRGRHAAAPRSRPLIGSPARAPVAAEKPPAAVRAAVERAFGVDLGHVPVHRGGRSAAVAEKIGAQAFAIGDQVHVPARHGGLESELAAPLLVHELAHAAQHERTRRGEPPRSETTLEHEARSVEESARSTESSRSAPIHAAVSAPGLPERAPRRPGAAPTTPPAAPAFGPSTEPSRPDPIRRSVAAPGGDTPDVAPLPIDELVRHLYERIRSRLRAELLVDRERAGTLTDLRVR